MRYNKKLALVLMAIVVLFACKNENKGLDSEGFASLFNGYDLDNWTLKIRSGDDEEAKKVFSIGDDKTVHVFKHYADSFNLNKGNNKTHGLFYTKKSYSKYIFKFEYKWGKKICNNFNQFQYDAGMYYHVYDDKVWPKGLEYQIRYDHTKNKNHTGDYWASGVKMQWYMGGDSTAQLPSKGGKPQSIRGGEHLASSQAEYNALNDKWNQCEVIVMGNKYSIHKLNGKVVNYATNFDYGEGIIGLQSETAEIFYRNIMIKEFDAFIPAEKFLDSDK